VSVLRLLIDMKADLALPTVEEGSTALHEAASFGEASAVISLLKARANALATDFAGNTALHNAVCGPQGLEAAQLLLEAQADLHAVNKAGETALQCAVAAEREDTVAFLQRASQ